MKQKNEMAHDRIKRFSFVKGKIFDPFFIYNLFKNPYPHGVLFQFVFENITVTMAFYRNSTYINCLLYFIVYCIKHIFKSFDNHRKTC